MTREQAQQMADSMFQQFDLNHDGVVTKQEATGQFGGGDRRLRSGSRRARY